MDDWSLVYSVEQDGVSLGTLYAKCDEYRGRRSGFVLVVRDGAGGVRDFFFLFKFLRNSQFCLTSFSAPRHSIVSFHVLLGSLRCFVRSFVRSFIRPYVHIYVERGPAS